MFILAALSIIPLAGLMGEGTDEISFYAGPKIGGFLNGTFGNATELIISFFALLVEIIVYNNAPSFTHFLESIFYFLHYPFHIQILLLHRKLINEREN